jgi:hypothetical protein
MVVRPVKIARRRAAPVLHHHPPPAHCNGSRSGSFLRPLAASLLPPVAGPRRSLRPAEPPPAAMQLQGRYAGSLSAGRAGCRPGRRAAARRAAPRATSAATDAAPPPPPRPAPGAPPPALPRRALLLGGAATAAAAAGAPAARAAAAAEATAAAAGAAAAGAGGGAAGALPLVPQVALTPALSVSQVIKGEAAQEWEARGRRREARAQEVLTRPGRPLVLAL